MAMTRATERTIALPLYDEGAPDNLKSGLTPTVVVSKDGAAFASATNTPAELSTSGVYVLTLTAAEMDADLVTVKVTAVGACDQVLALVTDPSLAALATAADLATVDGVVDAIKAKTDNLPSDPADQSELAALIAALPDDTDVAALDALLDAIKLKTDQIGAAAVTVSSPVAESGTVTIYQGDDYDFDHGRALEFAVADETHALGLDAATIVLKCSQATWTATSVTETADGYTVAFEPAAAETAALTLQRQSYELEAVLADGDTVTLATGTLAVERDIPAV